MAYTRKYTYRLIWQNLLDFGELVAFKHTIFSASFIVIALCVASFETTGSIWMGWRLFLLCALALISARNFAMTFNRFCDKDIDSRNQRTKNRPSVDGRISHTALIVFCLLNAVIFVLTSAFINDLALILSLPFLLILGGYSLMKRVSALAHLVLGISLGLAPIAGVVAVESLIPLWSIFLALGVAFWVAGFDVLYSLQDIQVDKKEGLFSIPARFGVQNALHFSRIFHLCAVVLWCGFGITCDLSIIGFIGIGVSACMLVYEQYLVHKNFANIPKAFFITNGYLGFILCAFVICDLLMRT